MNETVTLDQLRAYLAATGWQQRQPYGPYTDYWHHPSYSAYPDSGMVFHFEPGDTDPVRSWGILEGLARDEGRCEHEVEADILGRPDSATLLQRLARAREDVAILARVGRMYLDALDDDPENEYLTLGAAMLVTQVREAVERHEAAQ